MGGNQFDRLILFRGRTLCGVAASERGYELGTVALLLHAQKHTGGITSSPARNPKFHSGSSECLGTNKLTFNVFEGSVSVTYRSTHVQSTPTPTVTQTGMHIQHMQRHTHTGMNACTAHARAHTHKNTHIYVQHMHGRTNTHTGMRVQHVHGRTPSQTYTHRHACPST